MLLTGITKTKTMMKEARQRGRQMEVYWVMDLRRIGCFLG